MKNKYARDSLSAEMVDIIREGCTTDIAYVYGDPFNQIGYLHRDFIKQKKDDFASAYAKKESGTIKAIDKFVGQFESVK